MNPSLFSYLTPSSTLAVEDSNHSRTFVYIPDFKQAAKHTFVGSVSSLKQFSQRIDRQEDTNLVPSLAGSTKRQSSVGRPGN